MRHDLKLAAANLAVERRLLLRLCLMWERRMRIQRLIRLRLRLCVTLRITLREHLRVTQARRWRLKLRLRLRPVSAVPRHELLLWISMSAGAVWTPFGHDQLGQVIAEAYATTPG